jgi:hypothetical protein
LSAIYGKVGLRVIHGRLIGGFLDGVYLHDTRIILIGPWNGVLLSY